MPERLHYPVVPPELRCVWMTAGVLGFQICERDFECDDCPVDTAIRNMHTSTSDGDRESVHCGIRPLRKRTFYTQEHCWISYVGARTLSVGIEPNLAERCRGMLALTLPAERRTVQARVAAAWCRFDNGMIPVRLPFSAEIIQVNADLLKRPDAIFEEPFDGGWILRISIDTADLHRGGVMNVDMAEHVYRADEQDFTMQLRTYVNAYAHEKDGTMFDGGEPDTDALRVLGSAAYCALVRRTYCKAP